jgi:FkbM family methyltransferase
LEFELASLPEEMEALEGYFRWYRPRPGDIVFDVGAYCGVSTYLFSKQVEPQGKVVSFEPDATNFALLQRNVDRHGLSNVVPLNLAISDVSGSEQFCSEGNLGSALARDLSRASTGNVDKVRTISWEDACQQYGVPAFAKIDIEGSEVQVLAAARSFLAKHSTQFVLDTNHWVDGVRTSKAVEQLFADCGYVAESSDQFGFMTTWARKRDGQEDISKFGSAVVVSS